MKRIIATLAGGMMLLCISCTVPEMDADSTALSGKWKLDSVALKNDSNAMAYLFMAMALEKKATSPIQHDFEFRKDILLVIDREGGMDTITYRFHKESNELYVTDKDEASKFQFYQLSDAVIRLTDQAGNSLYLRRF
jgi:hypothetical protein